MRLRLLVLSLTALCAAPGLAQAGPIYNFGSWSTTGMVTSLGTTTVPFEVAPHITAQALVLTQVNGKWVSAPSTLISRNETNDHGLGVCSEASGTCHIGGTGGGDVNELSQLTNEEAILLSLAPGWNWSELWVSSLDSGDGPLGTPGRDGKEGGRVYWGGDSTVATLLGGPSFGFQYGDFGTSVEGNILGLSAGASFDRTARYALFRPDGALGANNDYLVYGASVTPVPEPGTFGLLGLGLAAAVRAARRRARA